MLLAAVWTLLRKTAWGRRLYEELKEDWWNSRTEQLCYARREIQEALQNLRTDDFDPALSTEQLDWLKRSVLITTDCRKEFRLYWGVFIYWPHQIKIPRRFQDQVLEVVDRRELGNHWQELPQPIPMLIFPPPTA